MRLWTDGNTHVQALTDPGRLRVFRDRKLAVEATVPELNQGGPLVVLPDQDRILAGSPLVELSLEDLSRRATHELELPTLAQGPSGELVTVGPGRKGEPALLFSKVDEALLGRWQRAVPLVIEQLVRLPQGAVDAEPRPEELGQDLDLVANQHGIVMTDGRAGVVLLFRPGADGITQGWAYPANDHTELRAAPFAHGLLVTPRHLAGDAHVHVLVDNGNFAPIIQWGRGCLAAAVGQDHIFAIDERSVVVFRAKDISEPITSREFGGRPRATTSGGGRFVVGMEEGIHILRPIGDGGLAVDSILVAEFKDLIVRFDEEQEREVEDKLLALGAGGLATRFLPDGPVEYVVSRVLAEEAEQARSTAQQLGASSVDVSASNN